MSYRTQLDNVAQRFTDILSTTEQLEVIPTEDFGWVNHRWQSKHFRLAHVERYSDDKIEVLHVTTFPHKWSPEPIYGFDVICTDNKVVGAYMDLSPGIITYAFDDGFFQERKPRPDWANVFSDDFILLKPIDDIEFDRFCDWAIEKYQWYITQLQTECTIDNIDVVIHKQNTYCQVQSQNPRTFSVLKSKIGEQRARYFMEEILFPKIK